MKSSNSAHAAALLVLLALAACGGDGKTNEDRQLDEAAAAIDVNAATPDNAAQ